MERRSFEVQGSKSVRLVCRIACAIALCSVVIPSQASALSWSSPAQIDNGALSAVSCPSVSLCVAVGIAGNVVTWTDPTGGSSAWTVSNVDGTNPLSGIACPSVSLCVAVGGSLGSNVVTSTDPTGGASAWTLAHLNDAEDGNPTAISCPSVSLCVAVDNAGNAITSTDPTGGAGAWVRAHVDTATMPCGPHGMWQCQPALTSVSCPTTSLCIAFDQAANGVGSIKPTGGASAWDVSLVDSAGSPAGGPTCSGGLCIAVSCPTSFGVHRCRFRRQRAHVN